jgi:hypothetical protein
MGYIGGGGQGTGERSVEPGDHALVDDLEALCEEGPGDGGAGRPVEVIRQRVRAIFV